MVSSSLLPENTGHGDVAVLILKNNQQTNLPKTPQTTKQVFVGGFKEVHTSSQIVCLHLRVHLEESLLEKLLYLLKKKGLYSQ